MTPSTHTVVYRRVVREIPTTRLKITKAGPSRCRESFVHTYIHRSRCANIRTIITATTTKITKTSLRHKEALSVTRHPGQHVFTDTPTSEDEHC